MGCNGLGDLGEPVGLSARQLDGVCGNVLVSNSWEEPQLRSPQTPPVAQDLQQPGGEHDISVFLSLALDNADHHALTIDGGRLQTDGFRDSQAGRVTGGENRAVLRAGHRPENA
jgi:hypothetical protein